MDVLKHCCCCSRNILLKHRIRKVLMTVKHLDPCFLTTLVNKSTSSLFWGNLVYRNINIPWNLYCGKIWCILLEGQSQFQWISFTSSTELKSSSPFGDSLMIFLNKSSKRQHAKMVREGLKKVYMRPCKIQCTFYCHRVAKNIAPLFVYIGPPPLGSKWPQPTQLSNGVGC